MAFWNELRRVVRISSVVLLFLVMYTSTYPPVLQGNMFKYTLTDDVDQTVFVRFKPGNTVWEAKMDVIVFCKF